LCPSGLVGEKRKFKVFLDFKQKKDKIGYLTYKSWATTGISIHGKRLPEKIS
jgi:hypothetical protein